MRGMKAAALLVLASVLIGPLICMALPDNAPSFSPEAISRDRVNLYLQAAKQPLDKLATEIYQLASESERCRMASGAKACGLPTEPLKASGLKQIFDYYVTQPVETVLGRQKLEVHKDNWIWQRAANRH